jgi:trans-aconitate methyltransferase
MLATERVASGASWPRRGLDIVGVDIDPEMLDTARRKAPGVDWHLADLATVDLSRSFDAIVMAGNVMIFLKSGTESVVVANMARHLQPDGLLIASFQIMRDRLTVQRSDYAERQSWQVVMVEEDHQSGVTFDRPGFRKLADAAKAGFISRLVVYSLDRFGRGRPRKDAA